MYIYIYIYLYTIRTRGIYDNSTGVHVVAFCSVFDGSASIKRALIGTVQTQNEGKPRRNTVPPCPLSASIITCLKCANHPKITKNALCLSLSDIQYEGKSKPTEQHQTRTSRSSLRDSPLAPSLPAPPPQALPLTMRLFLRAGNTISR
jgi:hypothetical protein